MAARVYGTKIPVRSESIEAFFEDRARRYNDAHPLTSVIYQDHNPDLAIARDAFEKETLLPRLKLTPDAQVLDIGCGIGRWAEALAPNVAHYHGTDFSEGLLRIARDRLAAHKNISLQHIPAPALSPSALDHPAPYSHILIIGLMIYLNDSDWQHLFRVIAECAADNATILIREPVGTHERLTLDGIWSEEMQSAYSAIYRSVDEYESAIQRELIPSGFTLIESAPLYSPDLSNRTDTHHHYFLLIRTALG